MADYYDDDVALRGQLEGYIRRPNDPGWVPPSNRYSGVQDFFHHNTGGLIPESIPESWKQTPIGIGGRLSPQEQETFGPEGVERWEDMPMMYKALLALRNPDRYFSMSDEELRRYMGWGAAQTGFGRALHDEAWVPGADRESRMEFMEQEAAATRGPRNVRGVTLFHPESRRHHRIPDIDTPEGSKQYAEWVNEMGWTDEKAKFTQQIIKNKDTGEELSFFTDDPEMHELIQTGQWLPIGQLQRQSEGPPGAHGELQKPSYRMLEAEMNKVDGSLVRLDELRSGYVPEFFYIENRASARVRKWLDGKLGFVDAFGEESDTFLDALNEYGTEAVNNLNLYIQQITGAQMSIFEAERIKKAVPDFGTGLLDGDGARDFLNKLNAVIRTQKLSKARMRWAWKNDMGLGLEGDDYAYGHSLSDVRGLMKKHRDNAVQELLEKYPDMPTGELARLANASVMNEFGVSIEETDGALVDFARNRAAEAAAEEGRGV